MNEPNTEKTVSKASPRDHERESTPNILVVDDDQALLDLLGRVLQKLGFRVTLAESGGEALGLFEKAAPDVVLLDINMPGMNGIRVLREIKAHDPDVEVVIITGYANLDSAVEALKHGAFDYLEKPFDRLDRVVDAVRRAWERRRPGLKSRRMKTSPERRIYELKLLYHISRLIASCTRPGEIVVQVLESLRKIIDYDLAMAMLVKGSKVTETALQAVKSCTPGFVDQVKSNLTDAFNTAAHSDMSLPEVFSRMIGEENIKSAGESRPTDEADSGPDQDPGQSRIARRLSSFLNVPLIIERRIVGMVNISGHRDDLFTPDDTTLIYALVSQIPSAIQRLEEMKAVERKRTDRLAEMVSEGVIMIDEDLQVLLVNRVAQYILGTKDADLKTIQDTLRLDLTSLKKRLGIDVLDLVVKETRIRSESYQVAASAIGKSDKTPLGFVISLRKSGRELNRSSDRVLLVNSKGDNISTTATDKVK